MRMGRASSGQRAALFLWLGFAAILPAFMAALLVGPRAPGDKQDRYCVMNLVTDSVFGLSLICDSLTWLSLAREPHHLLDKGSFRQSRPMFALPAYALRPLFLGFEDAPARLRIRPAAEMSDYARQFMPALLTYDFPGFLAYVVISMAELVGAFALYLWLVLGSATGRCWNAAGAAVLAVGAIGGLLIANDVVKAYVWAPQAQFFHMLVPLLCIAVLVKRARGPVQAAAIGFASGIAALAYPLVLLVPACFGLRALLEFVSKRDVVQLLARGSIVIVTTAIPLVGWYLFVMWRVGSFYSDAVEYNQLTWIVASFARGTLLADTAPLLGYLLSRAGQQTSTLVIAFAPVLAVFWLNDRRPIMRHEDVELCVAAIFVSILVLIFHLAAGLYMARVAYGMAPPLIVVCGVLTRMALEDARPRLAWGVALVSAGLVLAEFVHTAAKAGPYS